MQKIRWKHETGLLSTLWENPTCNQQLNSMRNVELMEA